MQEAVKEVPVDGTFTTPQVMRALVRLAAKYNVPITPGYKGTIDLAEMKCTPVEEAGRRGGRFLRQPNKYRRLAPSPELCETCVFSRMRRNVDSGCTILGNKVIDEAGSGYQEYQDYQDYQD